jgi:hypothetical protein
LIRAIALSVIVFAAACSAEAPEADLAAVMGEMQRHTMKLGLAIEGRNQPLSAFYLHEVEEMLEALGSIEQHEGMPIASPAKTILAPLLPPVDQALTAGNWNAAEVEYSNLVNGCNRCHTATEHDFIVITVPKGPAPWNQQFSAKPDAPPHP